MRFATRSMFCCTAVAVAALLAAGCGGEPGLDVELVPVEGTVTMNGQPVADATVSYYYQGEPIEGYFGSSGRTDANGRYQLASGAETGAPAGKYKVTVSKQVTADGKVLSPDEGIDEEQLRLQGMIKETIPAKYSQLERTELTAEVEEGKTAGYDFQLKTP